MLYTIKMLLLDYKSYQTHIHLLYTHTYQIHSQYVPAKSINAHNKCCKFDRSSDCLYSETIHFALSFLKIVQFVQERLIDNFLIHYRSLILFDPLFSMFLQNQDSYSSKQYLYHHIYHKHIFFAPMHVQYYYYSY